MFVGNAQLDQNKVPSKMFPTMYRPTKQRDTEPK